MFETFGTITINTLARKKDGTFEPSETEYTREGSPLLYLVPGWGHKIYKATYDTGDNAPIEKRVWEAYNARFAKNPKKQLPVSKRFESEILLDDGKYVSGVIGTTNAKDGSVLYIHVDDAKLLWDTLTNFYYQAEDVVRHSRALICDGSIYGWYTGVLRVAVVEEGTVFSNGLVVADGNIIYNEEVFPYQRDLIKLGGHAGNYSVWGMADYRNIKEDCEQQAVLMREELITRGGWTRIINAVATADDPHRKELLDLSPLFYRHPYVNGDAISAKSAITTGNWMHSPWLFTETCYAIATVDFVNWEVGNWSYSRYPQLRGSLRATTTKTFIPLPSDIVYGFTATITGKVVGYKNEDGTQMVFHAKGGGVVVSKMPDGYENCHAIMCMKTIKMTPITAGHIWEIDGCTTVLQCFDKDSLVGIPPKEWRKSNGDYDGDLLYRSLHDTTPKLFAEAKRLAKLGANFKFKKKSILKYSLDNANKVLLNAMAQDMGFATKLRWWWHSIGPDLQKQHLGSVIRTAENIYKILNVDFKFHPTVDGVDEVLSAAVQYQIDSIKNLYCDTRALHGQLNAFQAKMMDITISTPGYLLNKRSGVAYSISIPKMMSELDTDMAWIGRKNRKARKSFEYRVNIPDICASSTPVQLYKLHRPIIEEIWKMLEMRPNPLPLATFSVWVPPVTPREANLASELVEKFNQYRADHELMRQRGEFDPTSVEDAIQYKAQWRTECMRWTKEHFNGDNTKAMKVLWRILHDGNSRGACAAVFDGFFPEIKQMATDDSLSPKACRCKLGGFKEIWNTPEDEIRETCVIFRDGAHTIVNIANHCRMTVLHNDKKEVERGYTTPVPGSYIVIAKLLYPHKTAYDAVLDPL